MANFVETEPLVRREKNLVMVILPLDGPVENSWREIFDSTAKAAELQGYEVGITHDLRAVQGGTAAVASIALADLETKGLDARVKEILDSLVDLVNKTNDEDVRRTKAVDEIETSTMSWYKKKK